MQHSNHAASDFSTFNNEEALHYSQSAIGRLIANHRLMDQHGSETGLNAYKGKPLVISLIYTSCNHTCPVLTNNLNNAVNVAWQALGENSFQVISIGFDAGVDTPERMRVFAAERGIQNEKWKFLSGDKDTIRNLTSDLGFIFYPSTKGYDHLAQTTIVDAEGHVYRQIYGDAFEPPQLVEPLKELIYGNSNALPLNITDWIDNIRLFCTIYDPATGRYIFDYSIFITLITGVICLGAILLFLIHQWRISRSA